MTSKKKRELVIAGARVRVADPLDSGAERWENAQLGTVTKVDGSGVHVLLDGEGLADFHDWHDVDVERKPRPQWLDVPVGSIRPSRWQYRRRFDATSLLELAQSIAQAGLINRPLVFRDEGGEFELIAGERRVRACAALAMSAILSASLEDTVALVAAADYWEQKTKLLASPKALLHTVPVEVRAGEAADFREIVILENLQREDPSPVEEAEGFRVLLDEEGYTQRELAKKLGKSQPYVSQRLGLLGLAAEVRDVVEGQEISFTAARAIATLPEGVQQAVASHVQELAKVEGESKATTRKVQALVSQVRRFVDPEQWVVPEDTVVEPVVRNRMRLLRHTMETVDPDGDLVVRLRGDGSYYSQNLTGKQPLSVATTHEHTNRVVCTLTKAKSLTAAWQKVARAKGWTCEACQLRDVAGIEPRGHRDTHCLRWSGDDTAETCDGFIGPDDPVVMMLSSDESRRIHELGQEVEQSNGLVYLSDPKGYVAYAHAVRMAEQQEQAKRKEKKASGHLVELASYWTGVSHEGTNLTLGHAQAHDCRRCVHYTQYHGEDLPPCLFARKPIMGGWNKDEAKAPGMGVMVREDGLMVPRCDRFRALEMGAFYGLTGMKIPKAHRAEVLAWLERIARVANTHSHSYTLAGVLAWLPYDRDEHSTTHDRDKMVRWVRDHWDKLGDEAVAGLLAVARSEAHALGKYQEPIDLINPVSGETERWATLPWKMYLAGEEKIQRYGYAYPSGWPKPWVRGGE